MKIRWALAALATIGLLAGCSTVVNGTGSTALTGGASGAARSPDFPNRSGSAPQPSDTGEAPAPEPSGSSGSAAEAATPCPNVSYPYAHLAFACITTGMTQQLDGDVWPLSEIKPVDAAGSGWVLDEGAGHWGATEGHSLSAIAENVRQQMVDNDNYGDNPTVHTDASKDTTVDGAPAHLLQTTFTIDPAWAKANKVTVKQEKLWIIAIEVGSDDVSLWYVSVPDLVSTLWAKVPTTIASIKII